MVRRVKEGNICQSLPSFRGTVYICAEARKCRACAIRKDGERRRCLVGTGGQAALRAGGWGCEVHSPDDLIKRVSDRSGATDVIAPVPRWRDVATVKNLTQKTRPAFAREVECVEC